MSARPMAVQQSPFIVDAPAPMLKRHPGLSRNARLLYGTLRALADGKTGELKIKGRWRKASEFDREAQMCRCVRLRAMRELQDFGLVSFSRERIERSVKGRRRVVLGACHYTVWKIAEKPTILQQSISSTVEEIDRQSFSGSPFQDRQIHQRQPRAENRRAPHPSELARRREAKQARLAREDEVRREARVGAAPAEDVRLKEGFLEFYALRRDHKIPKGMGFTEWSKQRESDRHLEGSRFSTGGAA